MAVAVEIAQRAAGHTALLKVVIDRRQPGYGGKLQLRLEVGTFGHFGQVAKQAKAGDIGHSLHPFQCSKTLARAVQPAHQITGYAGILGAQFLLLFCGGQDTDAQRFGQKQPRAGFGLVVALELAAQHMAGDGQTKDRLRGINRVAASQRHASLGAHLAGTSQDFTGNCSGQQIDGPAQNGNGHHRRAAHGVDITDGVGSGDAAEIEWVVDNRHEEVGGADYALLGVKAKYGSVITAGIAHPEPLKGRAGLTDREHLVQHLG